MRHAREPAGARSFTRLFITLTLFGLSLLAGKAGSGDTCREDDDCGDGLMCCKPSPIPSSRGTCMDICDMMMGTDAGDVDSGPGGEDAGLDVGPLDDAGEDASEPEDAGEDAAMVDAGEDAGEDAGPEDAGEDAAMVDAGEDSGPEDAGEDAPE